MNFGKAITNCFSNYATFQGRATRPEYWYWILFVFLGSFCTAYFDQLVLRDPYNSPIYIIFIVVTFLPGIAVGARRLHDVNRSGWWLLLTFTVIGILALLYWYVQPSNQEENKY